MALHDFIKSYTAPVDQQRLFSTLEQYRAQMEVNVGRIDFAALEKWSHDSDAFVHESGKFFRICAGESCDGDITSHQPVIDQPEQGILGIISRSPNQKIEVLLQAKIEPGNLDSVQYSPTVQATKSNYTGVHKGSAVPYIEHFIDPRRPIKSRGYQSEHGYKFYKKANDNVHVHDNNASLLNKKFAWLSLNDVRYLLAQPHCINMDTRSVLATMDLVGEAPPYAAIRRSINQSLTPLEEDLLLSSLSPEGSQYSLPQLNKWLLTAKEEKKISHRMVPLATLYDHGWTLQSDRLYHDANPNFELVAVRAQIGSREVASWCQPIVRDNFPKAYAFLVKKIKGVVHVLAPLVEEAFSWNGPEVGPTLHSVDAERFSLQDQLKPFKIRPENARIIYDCFQSEEGGRFMEQKNRYMLIYVAEEAEVKTGSTHRWITLHQLKQLTRHECGVNIEARTLLAIASYFKERVNARD